MKILYKKDFQIMVYDDGTERNNIIVLIKMDGIVPKKTIKLSDEEEEWKDELAKMLRMSKEELGLD